MNRLMTGYRLLMMAGFELLDGFGHDDCAGMLDAPDSMAAGGTYRGEVWRGCEGTAYAWPVRFFRG